MAAGGVQRQIALGVARVGIGMLRKQRRGLPVSLNVVTGAASVSQTIVLRIF